MRGSEKQERFDEQPDWLKRSTRGIEGPENYSVYLEGTTHAIVRSEGGRHWVGRGMDWSYHPVSYALIEKGRFIAYGWTLHEGRITPAAKAMLRHRLAVADAESEKR